MNPDCSCVRGRCNVHKYVLKGKILERYLRDPAFADKVDHYDHDKRNEQRMARLGKQRNFASEIADLALISPKQGLGDRIEQALSMVGITKERVEGWLGRPCGCTERQEKLNQLSSWVNRVLSNQLERAEHYLNEIIGTPSTCQELTVVEEEEMDWSYGITTVPSRIDTTLPITINSLRSAGFDKPHLFVDGECDPDRYKRFGLNVTCREPRVRTFGNWMLSMAELYVRNPTATRFAMFQDDFITYRNLRTYLEKVHYPDKGYLNLYTFPCNQKLCPKDYVGFYPSDQLGKGAVALVFNNEAIMLLLQHNHAIMKFKDKRRGWKAADGGIVDSFKKSGWKEYVHNPSLVQHIGTVSSMGNKKHPTAISFMGEELDARTLIEEGL